MGAEEAKVEIVVEEAFAGGFVAGIAVVVEVFGVSEGDVLADEGEGFFEDLLHAGEGAGGEKVGRIHGDLEMGRSDLVQELAGFAGGIDDVVDFGFEGEDGLGLPGDVSGVANAGNHVAPGLGRGVVGMAAPHAGFVAGAGADVNGEAGEGFGENTEAAEAALAVFGVGVAHVEGAGEGGKGEGAGGGFAAEAIGESGGDFVGEVGESGTGEAELDGGEPMGFGFIEAGFEGAGGVGGGKEDADLGGWRGLGRGGCRGGGGQGEEVAAGARAHRFRTLSQWRLVEAVADVFMRGDTRAAQAVPLREGFL